MLGIALFIVNCATTLHTGFVRFAFRSEASVSINSLL